LIFSFTHGLGKKLQQVRTEQPEEEEVEKTIGIQCA